MRRWKVLALLVAGAVAGALLAGVAAASGYDLAANCVVAPLQFVFNGQSVTPQVANGNPAGFICNGTSYVPLRFVAQSMGATVGYNGTTDTITVASASAPAATASTCALTVDVAESGSTVWGTVTAAYGSTSRTLSAATQTLDVPCGTNVTLSEVPLSSGTWPFSGWTVAAAGGSATSVQQPLQVTVSGATTVTANYVYATAHAGGGY